MSLEIEPKELKFLFELKKQSTCSVQLTNNSSHCVAFKVKTTSPNRYSVRPNAGVLRPKSACEFIVTMQPQLVAPADMVCRDKFLIQSTIVPVGTTDEDVTSSLFAKDDSRYVEENKLKVTLISPPRSPEISPISGTFNYRLPHERDQIFGRDEILSSEPMVLKSAGQGMVNEELKHVKVMELKREQNTLLNTMKDIEQSKAEKHMGPDKVKNVEELKLGKDARSNTVEGLKPAKEANLKVSNGVGELKLMEAIEEMQLKLNKLESNLNEAGVTVSKLSEERRLRNKEITALHEKLEDLSKKDLRKVEVGFPLLYVCMVALICVFLGYHVHS